MNLTENEMSLLLKLQERNKGGKLTVINIERKSDREYDLHVPIIQDNPDMRKSQIAHNPIDNRINSKGK